MTVVTDEWGFFEGSDTVRLDKDSNSKVELVVVGGAATSATSARADLLGLLTKSGVAVPVRGDALKVRRPRGAPGLQGLRGANRSIRYARGRRSKPR